MGLGADLISDTCRGRDRQADDGGGGRERLAVRRLVALDGAVGRR